MYHGPGEYPTDWQKTQTTPVTRRRQGLLCHSAELLLTPKAYAYGCECNTQRCMDPGNDLLSRQKPLSSASVVSRPCSRWERVGPTDYVHREYGCLEAFSDQLSAISQAMSLSRHCLVFRRCIKKGDAKAECEQLDQDF